MSYTRCWICNEWTREDLLEFTEIEGRPEKVCLACLETLKSRDSTLEGKKRAKQRQAGLVPGITHAPGSGTGADAKDSEAQRTEPERMGSGADSPESEPHRKDRCFTQGCGKIATYSQTYMVDGQVATISIRRCQEHREMVGDLANGKLIRVDVTG